MVLNNRLLALALLAVALSGCKDVSTYPFVFQFIDNRTTFCADEFDVQWYVEYTAVGTDEFGDPEEYTASFEGVGSGTHEVDDAAGTGALLSYVAVYINTTCDPAAPIGDWSVLTYDESLETDVTLKVTLDDDDELQVAIIRNGQTIAQSVVHVARRSAACLTGGHARTGVRKKS